MVGRTSKELGQQNKISVLEEVRKHGAISRTALADNTGLTGTAITRISRELIECGLLEESEKADRDGVPGRRRTYLTLSSRGPYVIGLAMQATEQLICLANMRGEVLSEVDLPLDAVRNFTGYMDELCAKINQLIKKVGVNKCDIAGVSAAVPGVVDSVSGHVISSPLFGWTDLPIKDLLSKSLGLPVVIDNLNNALNLAESKFGLGQGKRNMMLFRVSYNVGASYILEGKLIRGMAFGAGQIGHMPVVDEGKNCYCGAQGCLNTLSSGLAILAASEKASYTELATANMSSNIKKMLSMLESSTTGNLNAIAALSDAGIKFGKVLNSFLVAFDPEQVLLAGQVGRNIHFVKGVKLGMEENRHLNSLLTNRIEISSMTAIQAAVFLALSTFVFSNKLNFDSIRSSGQPRG